MLVLSLGLGLTQKEEKEKKIDLKPTDASQACCNASAVVTVPAEAAALCAVGASCLHMRARAIRARAGGEMSLWRVQCVRRARGQTCLDAILGCATCVTGVRGSGEVRAGKTHEDCRCCCLLCDGYSRPCLRGGDALARLRLLMMTLAAAVDDDAGCGC